MEGFSIFKPIVWVYSTWLYCSVSLSLLSWATCRCLQLCRRLCPILSCHRVSWSKDITRVLRIGTTRAESHYRWHVGLIFAGMYEHKWENTEFLTLSHRLWVCISATQGGVNLKPVAVTSLGLNQGIFFASWTKSKLHMTECTTADTCVPSAGPCRLIHIGYFM